MGTMTPHISVVIPAFNRESYLGEAIESVLAQGRPETELIVVDDGSTDGTASVASSHPGVVCLRLPHRGPAAARNAGIAAARGELIAFLDSDDLWAPGKLAAQLEVLQQRRDVSLVFCLVEEFVSPELPPASATQVRAAARPQAGYTAGALLARRAAFDEAGRFDESLRVGEFVDWLARAHERQLRSEVVPLVLLHRRLHEGNLGRGDRRNRLDYVRVVKAHIERRRAGGK